jgi:putative Holliday junction resolvase
MRVMAVDYGDRRTGVAVSDALRSIPGDCFVVGEPCPGKLAGLLEEEYRKRGADTLVLGNPLNMNGTAGPRAEKTAKLKLLLERRGLNVILLDERRTTAEAESILIGSGNRRDKRRDKIDAVAASLILEGYLAREQFSKTDKGSQDCKPVP